ncbi:type IV pilin N-terminal domain-containing protein [Methanofollis ethanolicus]|uniref:type IV pilin N-terminal domain-containing protein n=1 Tax=Methanofollis ethanolicus TaxID=488124 RepID=UPI0009FA4F45|nr:type IV pilin N-terminal domain-containing protein [Methanofollis ethanolicus]
MCRERISPEAERPFLFFIERESAVSPVIGVMLMLVVTIIVAALVSSFSGGLSDSAEPAPTTAFDISIRAGDAVGNGAKTNAPGPAPECVVLTMVSGDTLNSADLKIITTYTVPETYNGVPLANAGKVIKHTLDGAIGQTDKWDENSDPFIPQVNGYNLESAGLSCLTPGYGMVGKGKPYFGTCLFKAGEPYWFKDRNPFLGFDVTDRTAYGFQEGSVVHVTIVHTPSGQTVYDRDVVATW